MKIELYLSNNRDALGLETDPPQGISVSMPPVTIQKSFGHEEAIRIFITVAAGIPAKLIAQWLYDKLKNPRSRKITINRKEIHVSEGEITRIIEQLIDIEEK